MHRRMWISGLVLAAAGLLYAQDAPGLHVQRAVTALGVHSRQPVGEGSWFPTNVGRVFLFSHIMGAQEERAVYHVWRHGSIERAKVRLPVRSASWRTWSSKQIMRSWTGPWTVEVQNELGKVLTSVSFVIEEDGG